MRYGLRLLTVDEGGIGRRIRTSRKTRHPNPKAMTTIQQLAANLAAQGMSRDEMIGFIYGCSCSNYSSLADIYEAVDAAIAQ